MCRIQIPSLLAVPAALCGFPLAIRLRPSGRSRPRHADQLQEVIPCWSRPFPDASLSERRWKRPSRCPGMQSRVMWRASLRMASPSPCRPHSSHPSPLRFTSMRHLVKAKINKRAARIVQLLSELRGFAPSREPGSCEAAVARPSLEDSMPQIMWPGTGRHNCLYDSDR